ncbi:MAG: hypothetical protein H0X02_10710 [Nitrosomonas sp.]|nr:hypothetical protein [Nitrosomonas sp.]
MTRKPVTCDKPTPAQPAQRSLGDVAEVFIIGVVTFLAALIWRDALKRAFTKYFPRDSLAAHLIAALIASVIAVLVIFYLSRNLNQVQLDAGEELAD